MNGRASKTLLVRIPDTYSEERRYVCSVLLGEFLGLDVSCETGPDSSGFRLSMAGSEHRLEVSDGLFSHAAEDWLTPASMPVEPLAEFDPSRVFEAVTTEPVPVLYGRPTEQGKWWNNDGQIARLGLDVFGSAFFMLARYEELACPASDTELRFPASGSLAKRAGFLDRPLVNEYLEILWQAILSCWPDLKRQPRSFTLRLTHDVDNPFMVHGLPLYRVLRNTIGDILYRGTPGVAVTRLRSRLATWWKGPTVDAFYTFEQIMNISDQHAVKSEFYFITDHTTRNRDGCYHMADPAIRELMRRIHERGHIIGLHPSYHTYQDPQQLAKEWNRLKTTAAELGIEQAEWGGRQHILRWEAPGTWQAWADAGLDYDSTVGFADQPGFRCGTCYSFPVFNLQTRQQLALWERPLTLMERSALAEHYQDLDEEGTFKLATTLAAKCRKYNGEFVLLWHNDQLMTPASRHLYERIVAEIVGAT